MPQVKRWCKIVSKKLSTNVTRGYSLGDALAEISWKVSSKEGQSVCIMENNCLDIF